MVQEDIQDSSKCDSSYSSICLLLSSDGENMMATVKEVEFKRDPVDVTGSAAALLGIPAERARCIHLPWFEKRFHYSAHMYMDLAGVEHGLAHNSDATQLWLIANLPEEPPCVQPDSIHGPVLLCGEDTQSGEYTNITLDHWKEIKAACREIQPSALFADVN